MNKWLLIAITAAIVPQQVMAEDLSKCIQGWDATESGAYARALALYNSCLENGALSAASVARTYRNIGITLRNAKTPAEAIKAYSKAIDLNPDDIAYDYINRGNAYDEAGDIDKALVDYAKAMEISPFRGEAYYNRGVAYEGQRMVELAKADFLAAYKFGLRTNLLYGRLAAHDLLNKVK